MTKSNLVRESIIKGYLNGKSYDEIAYENDVAKGSVSNVINAWIDKLGIPRHR
jgi:DNA-binding NarL/FixJ family response regulator